MGARRIDGQAVNGNRRRLAEVIPLDTPYAITVFPIYACNFKCSYCIHSLPVLERRKMSEYTAMKWNTYKKLIDDLKEFPHKLKVLHFIGYGEPLLHPDIVRMVHYAVQQNIAEHIDIVTNGSLLSDKISEELIDAGITRLRVSIQGLSDEAYRIRSGIDISFERLCNQLMKFREYSDNKKQGQLHVKIIDIGLSEVEKKQFSEIFSPIAHTMAIEQLVPVVQKIIYKKNGNTGENFNKTMSGNNFVNIEICPQPFYYMQIQPDGTCIPCCSEEIPVVLGHISERSVRDIWHSAKRSDFLKMQLKTKRLGNSVCSRCTQYKFSIFEEDIIDEDSDVILSRLYTE